MKISLKSEVLHHILLYILSFILLFSFQKELVQDYELFLSRQKGDFYFYGLQSKTIIEQGTIFTNNPRVGAPWGLEPYDFPGSEGTNLFITKIISWFTEDWGKILYIFYLLGFMLIPSLSYVVFRMLSVRQEWAIFAAIAFTFLPYHFFRIGHLWLGTYFAVPITFLLCLLLPRLSVTERNLKQKLLIGLAIAGAMALGGSGVYYAFFGFIFIFLSMLFFWLRGRNKMVIIYGTMFLLAITITVGANLYPSWKYHRDYGKNMALLDGRNFAQSEIYALKLIQMVLPSSLHRVDSFRKIQWEYSKKSPNVNENQTSSLGIVGVLGLMLIGWGLIMNFSGSTNNKPYYIAWMSLLALAAIFIAMPGGLGSVFSLFFTPLIRAWNRISVFIGFLAIGIVAINASNLVSFFEDRIPAMRVHFFNYSLCGLLLLMAVYDQTPDYSEMNKENTYRQDKVFFASVENAFEPGSAIYQLPYHGYPEGGYAPHWPDYEHIRGYLHTNTIRWSYGAIRNRSGDLWYRLTSMMPINKLVPFLSQNGFSGMYIDKNAYANEEKFNEIFSEIVATAGNPVLISENKKYFVFKIKPIGKTARNFNGLHSVKKINNLPDIRGLAGVDAMDDYRVTKENTAQMNRDLKLPTLVKKGFFNLSGWAGDPTSATKAKNYKVFLVSESAIYEFKAFVGISRPDVAAAYSGNTLLQDSGYLALLETSGVEAGNYEIFIGFEDERGVATASTSRKIILTEN